MANEMTRDQLMGFREMLPLHGERVVVPHAPETLIRHGQGKCDQDDEGFFHDGASFGRCWLTKVAESIFDVWR